MATKRTVKEKSIEDYTIDETKMLSLLSLSAPLDMIATEMGLPVSIVSKYAKRASEKVNELKILNEVRISVISAIRQGDIKLVGDFLKINDRRWQLLNILKIDDEFDELKQFKGLLK